MSFRLISLTAILMAMWAGAPAHANIFFVASNGTDGACSRTAPCATLAFVLGLDVVPSAGFLNINKSIDIDCSGARAVLRDGSVSGASILINIPAGADPFRAVRLRGFSLNGSGSGNIGKFVNVGIDIQAAAAVTIEDVVVTDMAQQGIIDHRPSGSRLFITDSIVRNSGGAGIVAAAGAGNIVVLDNVRSENNAYGVAAAAGNNVAINRSVLSGNSNAGVEADGGAQVVVNNSTITHNGIGVQSAASIRLSNNDIAFNTIAVSGASGTFGNNRFSGNVNIGTAPTPLGAASSDLGQQ
jgi:hypothetical protein